MRRTSWLAARRVWWTGALTFVLVMKVSSIADAHATLLSSVPAAGAKLTSMPSRLRLVFSEPIEPAMATIALVNGAGRTTPLSVSGDPHDVHAIVADVIDASAMPRGELRVLWHVVSADGHPVGGSFVFSVGTSDTAGVAAPPEPPSRPETSVWGPSIAGAPIIPALLRGVGVGCLLALGGLLTFMALSGTAGGRPERVAFFLSIAAPLFLGAHLAAWLINASPDHRADAAWMASTFASTVGKVELWRVGLSLLPLWALGLARRRRLALGLTIPPLLVSTAVGHSAGIHPMWAIPFKAIHLIALALWMGGLSWIVVRERVDARRTAADTARVSTIALWAVVVVTISGIVQTLMLVQSIAGMRSAYGLVVVAKVVGLGVLVAFGAYHRRRLVGAVAARAEQALVTLRSSVARELSVFCVVILLGGFLAYLSPPISGTASARSQSSEARP